MSSSSPSNNTNPIILGRSVPWTGICEWRFVKDALFDKNNTQDIKVALEIGEVWRIRGKLPVAVDATLNLKRLELAISSNGSLCDPIILQLAISAALLRMVNELTDPSQRGQYAMPVNRLAENIGLPRFLVDLRHESTHDALPSLPTLELGVKIALDWLYWNYWEPYSLASNPSTLKEKIESALNQISSLNSTDLITNLKTTQRILFAEVDYLDCSREKQTSLASLLALPKWNNSLAFDFIFQSLEQFNHLLLLSNIVIEVLLFVISNEQIIFNNEIFLQRISSLLSKPNLLIDTGSISKVFHSLMHHISPATLNICRLFFENPTVKKNYGQHLQLFTQVQDAYLGTGRSIPLVSADQIENVLQQIEIRKSDPIAEGPVNGWKPLPMGCSPGFDPVKDGFFQQITK